MCDYCDCRSEPEIAELSLQHEEVLELTRRLRLDTGDESSGLLDRLAAVLVPHTAREEAGVFAALRVAGVADGYPSGLEDDHVVIDDLLARAAADPVARAELVAQLEDHILREETDTYPAAHQMLGPAERSAVAAAVG